VNKPKLFYFEKVDVLHLVIWDEEEANSVELSPNVTAELNDKGELIGVEILNASGFMRDSIMETAQARLLNLTRGEQELRAMFWLI
jgi:uncharacterized protein YuzE